MYCFVFIQLAVAIAAAILGIFLILQPKRAIDIQIAFYRLINWKIEPISTEKEIKNTRIMGVLAAACAIISLIYIIIK